ncbi:MAG: hypothetical protein IIA87_00980 [Nanoarchaeota archaeon]|nr:hypothetical protein [Nanoarchaeota archaeon]
MEVEIINSEKNDFDIRIDNLTVAEILRVYLNEQGIKFAAWRREHYSKPIIFKIQTSGKTVKRAVSEAVAAIKKDSDAIIKGLKKK